MIADGSEPNTASFIQNYVQGAWSNWLDIEGEQRKMRALPLVRGQPRFWLNQELSSRNFLKVLGLNHCFDRNDADGIGGRPRMERGTMEALMATPISISELLIGKLIPYFCLGMGSMVVCVFVATVLYEVPFRGSYLALTLVSASFLLAALGQGLLISSLSRNQFVAAQAALIVLFYQRLCCPGLSSRSQACHGFYRWSPIHRCNLLHCSSQNTIFGWRCLGLLIPNTLAILAIAAFFFAITARNTVKRLE